MSEDDIVTLASRAGVEFRVYSLSTGNPLVPLGQVGPEGLCNVLFPQSARRKRLHSPFSEAVDWWFPI